MLYNFKIAPITLKVRRKVELVEYKPLICTYRLTPRVNFVPTEAKSLATAWWPPCQQLCCLRGESPPPRARVTELPVINP